MITMTMKVFIGRDLAHTRSYGEEIACAIIDEEVKRLIDDAHRKSSRRCSKRMSRCCTIVRQLLDGEGKDRTRGV